MYVACISLPIGIKYPRHKPPKRTGPVLNQGFLWGYFSWGFKIWRYVSYYGKIEQCSRML